MDPNEIKSVYFLGVGGTGMGSVAGLVKQSGRQVFGSDQNLYPPMSNILEEAGIEVFTPYAATNIQNNPADLYVIGNSMSVGKNGELDWVLDNKLPYTSFPELLNKLFLQSHMPCVVAGTHGKTTSSSLLAHCMTELEVPTSFFIGGRPLNFNLGFELCDQTQERKFFVLEGDEYDTAFFDKNSKFLHYAPQVLLLQNIEFDHADIFKDLDAIFDQFEMLVKLVADPKNIIACGTDENVKKLLDRAGLLDACTFTGDDESCLIKNTGRKFKTGSKDVWLHSYALGGN
jgi:UDP-N-acetylmuramate: L-alanyl-gamma-D-glutamyl-meso-diaminopimelate ligase